MCMCLCLCMCMCMCLCLFLCVFISSRTVIICVEAYKRGSDLSILRLNIYGWLK